MLDTRVNDVDELAEALRGWHVDLTQIEPGSFHGLVRQWAYGDLLFSYAHFQRRTAQRVEAPPAAVSVAVPPRPDFRLTWCGIEMSANDLAVFPNNGELDAVSAEEFELTSISIPSVAWGRVDQETGGLIQTLHRAFGRVLRCSPTSMRRLRNALVRSRRTTITGEQNGDAALTAALSDAIRSAGLGGDTLETRDARLAAVAAATRHIDRHMHRRIRVDDLRRAAGVSERTLQYAFQATFGLTPLEYVQARRLKRARAEIAQSAPSAGIIRRIAAAHGFRHMSRFAEAYREWFGELPSNTLRGLAESDPGVGILQPT